MAQVKICPSCGLENPLGETMCLRCMADISSVSPEEANNSGEDRDAASLVLAGVIGKIAVNDGSVLGRDSEGSELLVKFPTVSRRHARFTFGDAWTVEDLGSTNGTWVNGRRLPPGEKSSLKAGDTLSLSRSCSFTVQRGGSKDYDR